VGRVARPSATANSTAASVTGTRGTNACCATRDFAFFAQSRIFHVNLEKKPVELRLGERIRPFLFDRISRREHLKRIGQRVRMRSHRHTPLLHRLEERRLRLRRRSVDLVGQNQMVKNRPGKKTHAPPAHVVLEDVGAGDVGWKEVRRELHPAERQSERLGKGCDEQRLRKARHPDEECMPASQKRHEHQVDDGFLPYDAHSDGFLELVGRVPRHREQIHVARWNAVRSICVRRLHGGRSARARVERSVKAPPCLSAPQRLDKREPGVVHPEREHGVVRESTNAGLGSRDEHEPAIA
jgi:hypothetical protein